MERITHKHLDHQLSILNSYFGVESPKWSDKQHIYKWPTVSKEGLFTGQFYIAAYNGGFWLERIVNARGACTEISKRGTKREIYEQLLVLNKGLRLFKLQQDVTVWNALSE